MDNQLTVGKVAKTTGVNVQTVHYYERMGLVYPSGRKDSGYRLYEEEAVKKIHFIKNAQALGFTLHEIAGLLKLRVSHTARCGDVKRKAEIKLKDVQKKLDGLRALERTLVDLIKTCHVRATTDNCPILKSLEIQERKGSGRRK
jgi:MerR family mercuric resistance operon transcriptional regulator/MerR family gold-responsive transcriptional activator of gol and ges genes